MKFGQSKLHIISWELLMNLIPINICKALFCILSAVCFTYISCSEVYSGKKCIFDNICTGYYRHYIMRNLPAGYKKKILRDDITEQVVLIWKGYEGYKLRFKCNRLTGIKKVYLFLECNCERNIYNCADFKSHKEAQKCYEHCLKETGKDVHGLDRDKDGLACEELN